MSNTGTYPLNLILSDKDCSNVSFALDRYSYDTSPSREKRLISSCISIELLFPNTGVPINIEVEVEQITMTVLSTDDFHHIGIVWAVNSDSQIGVVFDTA